MVTFRPPQLPRIFAPLAPLFLFLLALLAAPSARACVNCGGKSKTNSGWLARELAPRPRPAAVIAHMCPIYAILAAPLARPVGVATILWYTHWHRTRALSLASRLVDVIASVDRRSVPLEHAAVAAIGHGIDVGEFACAGERPASGRLDALVLGRYSAAKGIEEIARGVALARAGGTDVWVRCHGATGSAEEGAHLDRLRQLTVELRLEDVFKLGGPVPRSDVPGLIASADLVINNMRAGAVDKVVFEACACGVPVLVSNPPFADLLGDLSPSLLFDRDDPTSFAERLADIAALGSGERHSLGLELRERVARNHSVESWADRVIALCRRPVASA